MPQPSVILCVFYTNVTLQASRNVYDTVMVESLSKRTFVLALTGLMQKPGPVSLFLFPD